MWHAQGIQYTFHQPDIGQVDDEALAQTAGLQAFQRQLGDFEIGLQAAVPVNLGAQLQRLTTGVRTGRARVQHRPAVAQAGDTSAVEQVGVDAGHLRRGVGTKAQGAAAELIHQLEGFEIQRVAGTRQEGLDVLQQRRHHQLVAVGTGGIEPDAAQLLHAAGLRRQNISDVLWQQPSRRHRKTGGD